MYKSIIKNDLNHYLDLNHLKATVEISYSSFEDYQYQSSLLFQLKNNKSFDSSDLVNYLLSTNHYCSVSITGNGFISFKMNLFPFDEKKSDPKTVIVDYCGVNVAKKMHIGHIRSMFIGDFVARSHQYNGDNVILYNHIGDWGNQFGFLLHYIIKNNLEHTLTNKNLTDYYKLSYIEYNESKETVDKLFFNQSNQLAFNLQNNKDIKVYELWKKCVDISMVEVGHMFDEFNLKLSLSDTKGESFFAPFCHLIIDDLLNKGIAQKNEDGAVFVLDDKNDVIVLQKSNGNFLYAIYDLAAIKWRVEQHNPDKIIYVVDNRQALHFNLVFSIAQKAGYASIHNQLIHLGFGTITGKDKKPLKTKEGQSLYLDELLEQGKNQLMDSTHFSSLIEPHKTDILNKTIVGGLKFYDLKFSKHQDYIFDWTFVLNFTGGSAPYIQNAYVRIDSILYKTKVKFEINDNNINKFQLNNQEQLLLFNIYKTYEIISELTDHYQSQYLTNQLITLCSLFHKYYESEKIIGHVDEDKKLMIISKIKIVISLGCQLLGIETYDCLNKLID